MIKLKSVRPIEYELQRLLGEGTFSIVYKALRSDAEFGLQQTIALKILKSKIGIEKWRDEFSSLERVQSARCVRVFGWDYIEDQPALILEWIEGITLADWISSVRQHTRTTQSLKLHSDLIDEICEQITEGLKDIFSSGNIHGDLSLQNIMMTPQGSIKLVDFGLSNTKELNFTAEFVAPEILMGEAPNQQSDLYSLGRIREYLERELKLPISLTTQSLLAEPMKRQYNCMFQPTQEERLKRQELLAEQLGQILTQRKNHQRLQPKTQMLEPEVELRQRGGWLQNAISLSLVLFTLNAGNAAPDTRPAHLYIKTHQWVEVTFEDKAPQYAPYDIELIPGRKYTIKWRTQKGQGQRSLTAEPGQNMVLSDQFFRSDKTE